MPVTTFSQSSERMLRKLLPYLSLFTSLGTLVCCALPALFVSLGAGAALVSILGTFPQLIWLSENKELIFVIAGVLLILTAVLRSAGNRLACPTDPELAKACGGLKNSSGAIFYASLIFYLIGAFFAFAAPLLFS